MAIVARNRKSGVVYYVSFTWQGKRQWVRSGTDKREAERLERRIKRQIADGTYSPTMTRAVTVEAFAHTWFAERKVRTVAHEKWLWEKHVAKRCPWFLAMRLDDLRPPHMKQLVEDLELPYTNHKGEIATLSKKSVAYIFAIARSMIRNAVFREIIDVDPCVLPKGTVVRKSASRREPYARDEVAAILACHELTPLQRAFVALLFATGARKGEVCGLRWHDYDPDVRPLGCLTIERQYAGEPLKTSTYEQDRPRRVPVHPFLARVLDEWKQSGFELTFGRKPQPSDPIIPNTQAGPHTMSSSYKLWRRTVARAGVENRSLHSTRHTFISLARRGGARKDVLERITHNAKGDIVDHYTHWEWAPLCEAILCLNLDDLAGGVDASVDAPAFPSAFYGPGTWSPTTRQNETTRNQAKPGVKPARAKSPSSAGFRAADADCDARQRCCPPHGFVGTFVDPDVQDYVFPLVLEAKRAALRGQEAATLRPLVKAAHALVTGRVPAGGAS